MNILAIDTSTSICCVSLYQSNKKIITCSQKAVSSHTKLLASSVDTIIKENNFLIKNLDYIILSIGPGSYSGLRSGSSFAKGLAYALDKNIIPINTIDAMNFSINDNNGYYIALHSHKDYVYYQKFFKGEAIGKQYCDRILNLEKNKFYGYGLKKFSDINSSEVRPSSLNLIDYFLKNKELKNEQSIAEITPLYLTKK
jgi:tRNA threonylcarbamoyl adenosine modification protein YeaZ